MTDRHEQARDEADRQWPGVAEVPEIDAMRSDVRRGFMRGVEWADANPQPHTITTSAHGQLVESLIGGTVGDHIGGLANLDHLDAEGIVESILRDLGIGVEDNDE